MIQTRGQRGARAAAGVALMCIGLLGACASDAGRKTATGAAPAYRLGNVGKAMSAAAARDPSSVERTGALAFSGTGRSRAAVTPARPSSATESSRAASTASPAPASVVPVAAIAAPRVSTTSRAALEAATLERAGYTRPSLGLTSSATGPVRAMQAVIQRSGFTQGGAALAAAALGVLLLLAAALAGFWTIMRLRRRAPRTGYDAPSLAPANDTNVVSPPRHTRLAPAPPLVTIRASR